MPLHDVPLPDAVFEGLPAGRAQVMTDSPKAVNTDRWRRELAAHDLPEPTGKLSESGTLFLSRADVFEYADSKPSRETSLQLLYASFAWGLGTKRSHLIGRLDGLAKDPGGAVELLVDAWRHVRSGADPQVCYEDLITQEGGGRISGTGPAFASKFLYFANGSKTSPRCVILDKVVAARLAELGVWPSAATSAWFPSTYASYCNLMSNWATEATERIGHEVELDEIEYGLFNGSTRRGAPCTAAKGGH